MHNVSDVRQTDIHSAEPLVPEHISFQLEIVIAKMRRYKSPDGNQIPAEWIQAICGIQCSEIQKLVNSIWNVRTFPDRWEKYTTA
jgi:hypothetical protein